MVDLAKLSPEEREIVMMAAKLEAVPPETLDGCSAEDMLAKAGEALAGYCRDHTQMADSGWSEKFEDAGVTEDEAKSAISCARRIGMEIG